MKSNYDPVYGAYFQFGSERSAEDFYHKQPDILICDKCKKSLNEHTSLYGIDDYDWGPQCVLQYCWKCFKKYKCKNPVAYLLETAFEPAYFRYKIQEILKTEELLFNWTQ
jgi:hypothetical protein